MRALALLAITALILTAVPRSEALTIHIPGDQPTIAAGLAAAAAGDTLLIECGTYLENSLEVPYGVVLRSANGSPDCVVIDGGRVQILSIGSSGPVVIEGITFTNGRSISGGAVVTDHGSVTFRDCRFTDNEATMLGGAVASLQRSWAVATFERCAFTDNVATYEGGAAVITGGTARFVDCVFAGNRGGAGAALNIAGDHRGEIEGCTFARNEGGGGAVSVYYGLGVTIHRSIIAFGVNTAAVSCGIALVDLTCCNLFGNAQGDFVTCAVGQNGVMGNFSADPLFCDADDKDFTLDAASPCLPGNHPAGADCGLIGARTLGCTVVGADGQVDAESWGQVKTAYRRR